MAKVQSALRNRVEYAGMLFGSLLLGWTPMFFAKALATVLADIWRIVDKRHRLRVMEQSMSTLGIDKAAAERLVRDNYRHYVYAILEIIRLSRLEPKVAMQRLDTNGVDEKLRVALAAGKGVVVATGHLGNWEWGCMGLGQLGAVEGVIARSLDNPLIDAAINRIRLRSGVEVWYKQGAIRKAMSALKRSRGFAAVIDQDGGRNGVMVPFLGRPASTMSLPVELALRTGSPIIVVGLMRDGDVMHFKASSGEIIWPDVNADPEQEKMRLLTAVNDGLSEIIRNHPEQWIWILNRWKTDRVREKPAAD